MAYIIPGIPPRPAPDAPGLLSPRGVAASLARATTREERDRAEQEEWATLGRATDAMEQACQAHPVPGPRPHAFYPERVVQDARCLCWMDSPAYRAQQAWRSNFCNHCGGEGICHPSCQALDARH